MPDNYFTSNYPNKANMNRPQSRRDDYYEEEEVAKPVFNVQEPFQNVINVQMNETFAALLCGLLEDIDGGLEPEIWAFKKALADPQGCKDFRHKRKKRFHQPYRNDSGE